MDNKSRVIYEKICEANDRYSLFDEDGGVLVALSGGADSVTLLRALREFFPGLSVFACHVNHQLRGKESERDREFARELCREQKVPIEVLDFDVASFARESRTSTETAARKVRYDFFAKCCEKFGVNLTATAHTASDNAETVLFNLTRGASLPGICGIPPKRYDNSGITLIRPLIFVTRDEVEAYLAEKGQTFVTDSTNLEDDYTRNYFRHNVIPLLKNVNPSFEDTLKSECITFKDAQIFIEKTANNSMTDDVRRLCKLDNCILSEVIVRLYKQQTGKTLIENVHVAKIAELLRCFDKGEKREYEVCLPGKISAIIKDEKLYFAPTVRKSRCEEAVRYEKELSAGINIIEGSPYAVYLSESPDIAVRPTDISNLADEYELCDSVILDGEKTDGRLTVRNRRGGDVIRSGGMNKKVKEILSHKKIPVGERDVLPIICDGENVIYVTGSAICDLHRRAVSSEGKKLKILIYRKRTTR